MVFEICNDRSRYLTYQESENRYELLQWIECNEHSHLISYSMTTLNAVNEIKNPNYSFIKDHMTMHSEHEPLSYSKFYKQFSNDSILKDHMMVHSGNEPFLCSIFDKGF